MAANTRAVVTIAEGNLPVGRTSAATSTTATASAMPMARVTGMTNPEAFSSTRATRCSRAKPTAVGMEAGVTTTPGTLRALIHPTPRPYGMPQATVTTAAIRPAAASRTNRPRRGTKNGSDSSAIGMAPMTAVNFTPAATPTTADPAFHPPRAAMTSAALTSPMTRASLCMPPMPWASTNGDARVRADARAGSTSRRAARRGTAQAVRTRPRMQGTRCSQTSRVGSLMISVHRAPHVRGNGPYGVGV